MKIASKLTNYKFLHFFNLTTDSYLKKSDNRIPELLYNQLSKHQPSSVSPALSQFTPRHFL